MLELNVKLHLADVIAETDQSIVYSAKEADEHDSMREQKENGPFFAFKKNRVEGSAFDPEREIKINHAVESFSEQSITIPILFHLDREDGSYDMMQFRKNGMFLKDIIARLEEKYGKCHIPLEFILKIIDEILYSLSALHGERGQAGFIHLDLQLGNIFMESVSLSEDDPRPGHAKFIDLAGARRIGRDDGSEDMEKTYITEGYSAPELWSDEPFFIGIPTDLFSVGAILYRFLCGKTHLFCRYPSDLSELDGLDHYMESNPVPYRMLEILLRKVLAEDPRYRFSSAGSFRDEIRRILSIISAPAKTKFIRTIRGAYEYGIPYEKCVLRWDNHAEEAFAEACSWLESSLKKNIVDHDLTSYTFYALWEAWKSNREQISGSVLSGLIYSGISCCNNSGDPLMAIRLFEMLKSGQADMKTEDYLAACIRASVSYEDIDETGAALALISRVIDAMGKIRGIRAELIGGEGGDLRDKNLARAWSRKAVLSAANGKDRETVLRCFDLAIEEFGEDIQNIQITACHILEYAVHIDDQDLFERFRRKCFCSESTEIGEIFRDLIDSWKTIGPYPMSVFLKSIDRWYADSLQDGLAEELRRFLYGLSGMSTGHHPMELIYKHLGIILYKHTGKAGRDVRYALQKALNCIRDKRPGPDRKMDCITAINYRTAWEYEDILGGEKREELLRQFIRRSEEDGFAVLAARARAGKEIPAFAMYENL